jgi:hypothetical protein
MHENEVEEIICRNVLIVLSLIVWTLLFVCVFALVGHRAGWW